MHSRRPPRGIVLDMDSSVSPTHGEQEKSVWNGHYECTCYHPLFVFNQFGDLERCSLRPGNIHSADGWENMMKPVIARYHGKASQICFRAERVSLFQGSTSTWRPSASNMRSGFPPTASCKSGLATCSRARSGVRRTKCAASTRTSLHLSGRKLDKIPPCRRQGRMASGRTLPARRLYCHQHG